MHSSERSRAMGALTRGVTRETTHTQRSGTGVPLQPVLLLLERRHSKASTERLADAWYYHYPSNETTHKIVDLTTGVVRSADAVIDVQLPLVDEEINRAFDVVLRNASHQRSLEAAYREVTGSQFSNRSQISYKAFVFHPDTVQDGLTPEARRCGIHRCAQMLLYTHDNVALDMSPIVDLSTGRVLQNLELRTQALIRREVITKEFVPRAAVRRDRGAL